MSRRYAFPVPDINVQDALDSLRGRYFATFDLLSGYWQLAVIERAKERPAVCTRRGLFHFTIHTHAFRLELGLTYLLG